MKNLSNEASMLKLKITEWETGKVSRVSWHPFSKTTFAGAGELQIGDKIRAIPSLINESLTQQIDLLRTYAPELFVVAKNCSYEYSTKNQEILDILPLVLRRDPKDPEAVKAPGLGEHYTSDYLKNHESFLPGIVDRYVTVNDKYWHLLDECGAVPTQTNSEEWVSVVGEIVAYLKVNYSEQSGYFVYNSSYLMKISRWAYADVTLIKESFPYEVRLFPATHFDVILNWVSENRLIYFLQDNWDMALKELNPLAQFLLIKSPFHSMEIEIQDHYSDLNLKLEDTHENGLRPGDEWVVDVNRRYLQTWKHFVSRRRKTNA